MAFADPITLSIGADTYTFNRVSVSGSASIYQAGDVKLTISHVSGKRNRRTARIDFPIVAPDPLFPATNVPYSMAVYSVIDVPTVGIPIASQLSISLGLFNWLVASSGANTSKVLTGQS
jgi:hypothetical protein